MSIVAPALADVLKAAQADGGTVAIFCSAARNVERARPCGWAARLRFAIRCRFASRRGQLPVVCIGPS